ncbi:hypothetical protein BJ166DRAFT_612248 [Pestalotiopsis sp. NC0098]|nr:hypothetical protein BJ166DRAFT_612248 [Pestalotiopsis sp. NC0098]
MASSSASSSSRAYSPSSSSRSHTSSYVSGRARIGTGPSSPNYSPKTSVSDLAHKGSALRENPRPLDFGSPGFNATIALFEGTPDEKVICLGPWEVVGTENRRVLWQGSYQLERLEHFLPCSSALETFPHTLHSRHRQFSDPDALEQTVTFNEPHRVRYTNQDGVVTHNKLMRVSYKFITTDSALSFQGDLREKDLVDWFDVDVVWTDTHARTDAFGSVCGIGTVQRLKFWADRQTSLHSLTVFANRERRNGGSRSQGHQDGGAGADGRRRGIYREFQVYHFQGDFRLRDNRRRRLELQICGDRRGSSESSVSGAVTADSIRYLGIQFSRIEDYRRFLEAWAVAHRQDSRFPGITLPLDVFELPSPQIAASAAYGHVQQSMWQTNLPILPPPAEEDEDEGKDKEDIKGEFKYNTKEDLEENIKVFQEEFGKEINEEINEEVKDQSVEEIGKGAEKAIKEEVSAERFKKAKEQFEKDDEKEFADREEPEVREEVREEVEEKIEGEVEEGAREEVREEVEDDRVSEADHDKDIDVSRPRSEKPLESHPLVRMFNPPNQGTQDYSILVNAGSIFTTTTPRLASAL